MPIAGIAVRGVEAFIDLVVCYVIMYVVAAITGQTTAGGGWKLTGAPFLVGLGLGGHLFRLSSSDQGASALLQVLPMIANLGSGLLYVFCWFTDTGFAEHAQLTTYEYGNTFLLVAGLLNYLVMLDAFDLAAGRKQ